MSDGNIRTGPTTDIVVRYAVVVLSIALAFTVGFAVLWVASTAVFAVLVGLLLAVIFDAFARGLGKLVNWDRRIRLVIVFVAVTMLISGLVWWGGSTLVDQAGQFVSGMKQVPQKLNDILAQYHGGQWQIDVDRFLPSVGTIFGGATQVASSVVGTIVIATAIIFLGAFFTWEPDVYKSALLSILPQSRRRRMDEVLDLTALATREWLLGQSVSMAVIFAFTLGALVLVGMPYPVLLALLAGLLVFIPTVGPAIAGIIIILAGLAHSVRLALYGIGTYLAIQFLETHLVTPLVQERTVRLPPAFTLGVQLVTGYLFGLIGLAFAVPLAAAAKVLIDELYVKDWLGGPWEPPKIESDFAGLHRSIE